MRALEIVEARVNERKLCPQAADSNFHSTPHPNTTSGSHISRSNSGLVSTPFMHPVHVLDDQMCVDDAFHKSPHPSAGATRRPEDVLADSVDIIY